MPILDHTPDHQRVEERLRQDLVAWLATVRPDGRPHLVPVWFLWDGQALLILSQPMSQKVRNLRLNPWVTVALDNSREGHEVVLCEGTATLLDRPSREVTPPAYVAKYRQLLAPMEWPPDEMIAEYSQAIRVEVTRFITW
jgi:PPOX class probable F420-dependent enzyme